MEKKIKSSSLWFLVAALQNIDYKEKLQTAFEMLSASYRLLAKRAGSAAVGLARVGGVRSYVAPMKDVDFLLKDVWNVPAHYKALGYDDEVI